MTNAFGKPFEKFPALAEQRQEIVDQVIASMESGSFQWMKGWVDVASPRNPVTGTQYRGSNRVNLSLYAVIKQYGDPRWVTWNQAKAKGWHLKEGEAKKYACVEHWSKRPLYKRDENKNFVLDDDGKKIREGYYLALDKYYRVYNAAQFEDFPEMEDLALSENHDQALGQIADDLIASSRCEVVELLSGDCPCYSSLSDKITIPLRQQFDSNESFVGDLLHEMAHSTMHPSALNRTEAMGNFFGSNAYAKEELVAELSSVFSAAELGLHNAIDETSELYQNHIAYLQNWSRSLREEPTILYEAASKAEKATGFVMERYDSVLAERGETRALVQELAKAKQDAAQEKQETAQEKPHETPKPSLSERRAATKQQVSKDEAQGIIQPGKDGSRSTQAINPR